MDYISLFKILLEWGIKNQEYKLVYFIYSEFNIGVPCKFLYKLPNQNIFYSLNSFMNNNGSKKIDDKDLEILFSLFLKSKYKKLENWNNCYGYSLV